MARANSGRGAAQRAWWPWFSLLPLGLGSWAPIVGAYRYREWKWAALGVFWCAVSAAGWILVPAKPQNSGSVSGGLLIVGWVGAIVTSFTIRSMAEHDGRIDVGRSLPFDSASRPRDRTRAALAGPDRWPWISLVPFGLGAWAPMVAGVRCRVWWWALLGAVWSGAALTGIALASPGASSTSRSAVAGALVIAGWAGAIVTSFAIRPSYDRRRGLDLPATPWPTPTVRSRGWSARYALSAYVATFVAANALGVMLRYGLGVHVQVGLGVLIVDGVLLAGLIPLRRRRGLSGKDLGLRVVPGLRSLGVVIIALLAYVAVTVFWALLVQPPRTQKAAQILTGAKHLDTLNVVLVVVAVAASAPIIEEIFFRGLLYRSVRNRLAILPAALICGCLFGLVHITSYPLVTLPVKAAFGVIACLLYERTGSLLPGIALHAFVDGTVIDLALTGNDFVVLACSAAGALTLVIASVIRSPRRRPPTSQTATVGSPP